MIYLKDNKEGIKNLPEKSINLIIADPPYYKIKGDFDFIFKNFQEYLDFIEEQANLYKRVLKDNGSLFVYGHARNIAYVQVIFDKYFNLINNLVWEKLDCQTKKGIANFKCFPPITERILFYSNEVLNTGLEEIHNNPNLFLSIKKYMRNERDRIRKDKGFDTLEKFNQYINEVTETSSIVSKHYFSDSQYCPPTEIIYKKLQSTGYFRREYEDLRREYEDLRRYFNNKNNLYDVIRCSQESNITKKFDHDTIKPIKLTIQLIETTTRENDLVLIPFGGSGTECISCIRTNRKFISFENNEKYFNIAYKRIQDELDSIQLLRKETL